MAGKTMKKDWDSRIFDGVNLILLLAFTAIIVIPIWNIVIASVTSGATLTGGNFIFWPEGITFANYQIVFSDSSIWRAFFVSIMRTLIGSGTSVLFTSIVAYGLSKRQLIGRKLYTVIFVITMFFSGGMIPMFLLIRSLGLLDSFWVYIIPALFSYWNVIILMNFFRGIPESLEEAAQIDGAGYWRIFFTIILPLSKPALATIALFNGVGHWNDFMATRLYIPSNEALHTLQFRVFQILAQTQLQEMQHIPVALQTTTRGVQLATIVVTTVPIVLVYPFLQKYFVSGMTLGAVKE
jgi:putative aldouronate transport system permease protein